jgi:hypothetical protein
MQDVIDREDNDARKFPWKELRGVVLLCPIHFAAYAVDPDHHDHHQLAIPQCMAGFSEICEKLSPGGTARQADDMTGMSAFLHGDGVFGRDAAKAAASMMPAYRWSQMFATTHPDFQYAQGKLVSLYSPYRSPPQSAIRRWGLR